MMCNAAIATKVNANMKAIVQFEILGSRLFTRSSSSQPAIAKKLDDLNASQIFKNTKNKGL